MNSIRMSVFLICALVAACAATRAKDPIYKGEYFYNFESSYLTPEGEHEAWCVDPGVMGRAMLPAVDANGPWGRSRVVVRGKLGPSGSYGGLGRCKHVLIVTDIVEVKEMRGRGE